ncbi:hypothetical protein LUZ60_010145 [Juncus effusus]|nr:hypothetical protein LUZ60_010145 [Juncus effusus]
MAKALGASFTKLALFSKPLSFSNQFQISPIPAPFSNFKPIRLRTKCAVAEKTKQEQEQENEEIMSIDNLHRFFNINLGKWNGSFYQFDAQGNLLQKIRTKLSVSTYGEDELISLLQSLYIKQAPSSTSISGQEEEEGPEWIEYKIKETNLFTVDKYQQIGFFPKEKAYSLRYQTAGMLETVLRVGVLGEDDFDEENPKNLKIPSKKPSVVCENCLYSLDKERRIRAFHILDPKGILEMILIFIEDQGNEPPLILNSLPNFQEKSDRISRFLGKWKGHSVTKRSGVYGATISEADTFCVLDMNDKGQVIQDISTTKVGTDKTSRVPWTGSIDNNIVKYSGGYEMTFLPSGIYIGCPADVSRCVGQSQSFHLELCWMESPDARQRLVRTYDWEGMAVSSTYFYETRV